MGVFLCGFCPKDCRDNYTNLGDSVINLSNTVESNSNKVFVKKVNLSYTNIKKIIIILLLIQKKRKKFLPTEIIRYEIVPYIKRKNKFHYEFFNESIEMIEKIELTYYGNKNCLIKSNIPFLNDKIYKKHKCILNPIKHKKVIYKFDKVYLNNIIDYIIDNNKTLTNLKREVTKYFIDHGPEPIKYINGRYISSFKEYFYNIIKLANCINLSEVNNFIMLENNYFIICTNPECANFFNFINMIYTRDKIFMRKIWKDDEIKQIQKHDIKIYNDTISLIKLIKNNLCNLPSKIKFMLEPLNYIDVDVTIKIIAHCYVPSIIPYPKPTRVKSFYKLFNF